MTVIDCVLSDVRAGSVFPDCVATPSGIICAKKFGEVLNFVKMFVFERSKTEERLIP
jgi:hypothetical protein